MSTRSDKRAFFRALSLAAALCVLVYAAVSHREERTFRNPIAYALTDEKLFVLEKEHNTLLELTCSSTGEPLEAIGSHEIEPDDADHYYMVRKLYPGPAGIVVQSWIYSLRTRDFLGYRFSMYATPSQPPRVLLTIVFKNPRQYPEMAYAHDLQGNHCFVPTSVTSSTSGKCPLRESFGSTPVRSPLRWKRWGKETTRWINGNG
jgi:hypothetical protein